MTAIDRMRQLAETRRFRNGLFSIQLDDICDLIAEIDRLTDYQRWRPIAELHEDFGSCVLININDPSYMAIGSNLDMSFEPSLWTHFSRIAPLSDEDHARLCAELGRTL